MSLKNYNHEYFDAPANAFLRRELEYVRTKMYETLFPQFQARSLVTVNHEVPNWAEVDTFNVMAEYGEAKLGGGYTTAPPRVGVSISDVSAGIKPITAAYGWSLTELRKSVATGRRLDQLKARVARTVVEQLIDQTIMLGSSAEGLAGLFLLSGTNTQAPLTGAVDDTWANKTSDEVIADLNALKNKSVNVSKSIYSVDTIAMCTLDKQFLEERRMRDSNNTSILDHFRGVNPGIEIKDSIFLESNTGWTGTRIMAYYNSPEFIESVIPQEFEQLAPQTVNYETVINCHARIAGIRLPHPKSVTYMDNVQSS